MSLPSAIPTGAAIGSPAAAAATAAASSGVRRRRPLLHARELPLDDDEDDDEHSLSQPRAETSAPSAVQTTATASRHSAAPAVAAATTVTGATTAAAAAAAAQPAAAPSGTAHAPTTAVSSANPATLDAAASHAAAVAAPRASTARPGGDGGSPRPNGNAEAGANGDPAFLAILLLLFAGLMFVMLVVLHGGMSGLGHNLGLATGAQRKMQDSSFRLSVPLESLARGDTVTAELPGGRQRRCPFCAGTGGAHGTGVETCSSCHGRGSVEFQRQIMPGFFQTFHQKCTHCGGRGKLIRERCTHCRGGGMVQEERVPLHIPLPAGAPEGWTVVLRGQGDEAPPQFGDSVAAGDVLVQLVSAAPPASQQGFRREGKDLHTQVRVPLLQALQGIELQMQLPHAPSQSQSQSQSQSLPLVHPGPVAPGSVLTFPGRGMPAFDGVAALHANDAPAPSKGLSALLARADQGLQRLLVPLGLDKHASVGRNLSTPAGDLHVQVLVEWPRTLRLSQPQKDELKRLLGD